MQQKWWLVAAGVVGIGLAVLLFPRPDTGDEVPEPDLSNTEPLEFRHDGQKPRLVARTRSPKRDPIQEQRIKQLGPHPLAIEQARARDNPASLYAGRASGPWAVIKRQLGINGSPEALELSAKIDPLVSDLRMLRRDPANAKTWDEIEAAQRELAAIIGASDLAAEDELLATSLGRVENYIADYHTAMAEEAAEAAEKDQGEDEEQ